MLPPLQKPAMAQTADIPDLGGYLPVHTVEDRVAAAQATGLMDTGPDPSFDRLSSLARKLLRVPIALVTLIDGDRQFFKSGLGLPAPYDCHRQTPLSHSFCKHVAETGAPLRIQDARLDPVHFDNPLVAAVGVVAYLGVPLRSALGVPIGSFCVIDTQPREWTDEDIESLREFAAAVESEFRLRDEVARRVEAEAALGARQAQIDLAMAAAGNIGIWEWEVGSETVRMDANFATLFGLDPESAGKGLPVADYIARIPSDERIVAEAHVEKAVREGGPYAFDHRVERRDGSYAWVSSRGICTLGVDGRPSRFTGVISDITHHRLAIEHQTEMAKELGHRVKNMMSTVQAVVLQTLRVSQDVEAAAQGVVGRMQALSRAHDLLVANSGEGSDLSVLAEAVAMSFGAERFDLSGPSVPLSPSRTLAMSMALHEMATNAVKYGSLSSATGRVSIAWSLDDAEGGLSLAWTESGGPAVAAPTRQGLGTRLLKRVIAAEIGGAVEMSYLPAGVECRIRGWAAG